MGLLKSAIGAYLSGGSSLVGGRLWGGDEDKEKPVGVAPVGGTGSLMEEATGGDGRLDLDLSFMDEGKADAMVNGGMLSRDTADGLLAKRQEIVANSTRSVPEAPPPTMAPPPPTMDYMPPPPPPPVYGGAMAGAPPVSNMGDPLYDDPGAYALGNVLMGGG